MKINRLPAPTWNRLLVNDSEVTLKLPDAAVNSSDEIPDGVAKAEGKGIDTLSDVIVKTGLGEEFDSFVRGAGYGSESYVVSENTSVKEPLYQSFELPVNCNGVSIKDFNLGEGSDLLVIQNIKDDAGSGVFTLQNKYRISKGASLTVVQVQTLSDEKEFYNDFGGYVEDGGSFKLIQIILGGGKNCYGSFAKLAGRNSRLETKIAYSLDGSRTLDMNYVADHTGQSSESDINVSGVLKGTSGKLFRGTIDFHKGCAGAKGSELEDVLLIDDTIVNRTVPLILCDEEDVEGAHGATIGKLADDLLLYFGSRGIPEDEAYKLMERAKIDAVAGQITDERTRTIISDFFERGTQK